MKFKERIRQWTKKAVSEAIPAAKEEIKKRAKPLAVTGGILAGAGLVALGMRHSRNPKASVPITKELYDPIFRNIDIGSISISYKEIHVNKER